MQAIEPLEFGHYYHVYNRGINGCDLFTCEENFEYCHKQFVQDEEIEEWLGL